MSKFSKKAASVALSATTVVWLTGASLIAPIASAQTTADIQAQINALLAQITALQTQLGTVGGAAATACSFTRDLTVGAKGDDVTCLQNYLISQSAAKWPSGQAATGYFGPITQASVTAWQAANAVSPAAGYFGTISRAKYTSVAAATPAAPATPVTPVTTLTGGAGSVEEYDLASGLANEEVGEDEKDVKVAGLEITVDEGSDLKFTAVQLTFNEGTAGSDFEDYVDEVSLLMGNKEVARVDGDAFNDDNDWTKTVTLSGDNVIKAEATNTLYVAVSGVSNLDTNDDGDTWTVDFTSIRFVDALSATISEDPTVAVTTFSLESFAAAADVNFKITKGDDDINDAHVINVDDTDDTDNVDILSFNVEIEGDSDIDLDALPINFDVTGAANVDDMISGLSLRMDGDEVGSAAVGSDCIEDADCVDVGADETYLFDNLDLTLEAGKDYDFIVRIDLQSIADDLDAGDTIAANFGETETDLADFDAEDESGTDMADGDVNGTVTGEASAVYDTGIMLDFVSVASAKTAGDPAATTPVSDSGTFTITFDVTAFDGDAYIDHTAPDASGGTTESDLDVTGTGTVTAIISSSTGATDGTDGFLVVEDTTERFAITTNILATASGYFDVELTDLLYALTDADGDLQYTFNLDDYKTASLYLYDY